jgi:hypothetical protein
MASLEKVTKIEKQLLLDIKRHLWRRQNLYFRISAHTSVYWIPLSECHKARICSYQRQISADYLPHTLFAVKMWKFSKLFTWCMF